MVNKIKTEFYDPNVCNKYVNKNFVTKTNKYVNKQLVNKNKFVYILCKQ